MRLFFILIALAAFCVSVTGQVINNTSMSAEWARSANRNASSDAVDILVYNPAGLIYLKPGLHLNLGNQTLLRAPEHSFTDGGLKNFKQESPDFVVPSLYAAYRFSDFAVYFGMYITGGGASADYDKGSLTTTLYGNAFLGNVPAATAFTDPKLKATSYLFAFQTGMTWAVNPIVSISAGPRYVYGFSSISLDATVTVGIVPATAVSGEAELTASGIGGVFGVDIRPIKPLLIALRFDTAVSLEYTTSLKQSTLQLFDSFFPDGETSQTDLPAVFAAGISYDFGTVRVEADFTWFFQSGADWGTTTSSLDISELAGDCYNLGLSINWQATPTFLVSGGYVFTKYIWKDKNAYYSSVLGSVEAPSMDNHYFAAGFAWTLRQDLKLNFGLGMTLYPEKTIEFDPAVLSLPGSVMTIDIKNSAFTVALGLDWRITL